MYFTDRATSNQGSRQLKKHLTMPETLIWTEHCSVHFSSSTKIKIKNFDFVDTALSKTALGAVKQVFLLFA